MAQTVSEIKAVMTAKFMADPNNASAYGFTIGDNFEQTFSKVSLESILFYIVAFAHFILQSMFDTHKTEMTALLDAKKPHRLKWYRDKALQFRFGRELNEETGEYDLTGIDLQTIESELVVKYASCFEYQGKVFIKVAGGSDTAKEKLSPEIKLSLENYFSRIKDAGVVIGDDSTKKTSVINEDADYFATQFTIYYDPLILDGNGMHLTLGTYPVKEAIKDFIENRIPFNGEYRNSSLVDALQLVEGVVIPELTGAQGCSSIEYLAVGISALKPITAKAIPYSGYYKIYDDDMFLTISYEAYQTIESV